MSCFRVLFEENGSEYSGYLLIKGKDGFLEQINDRTIKIDGVEIEIDEHIISIESVDEPIEEVRSEKI